mmetsp:Transcript_6259/g.20572  ORF Transcript_6259/g.20572 Transcript_6259/m.20572 type:complete len:311 (+) Transcript_6259:820-1752(+)
MLRRMHAPLPGHPSARRLDYLLFLHRRLGITRFGSLGAFAATHPGGGPGCIGPGIASTTGDAGRYPDGFQVAAVAGVGARGGLGGLDETRAEGSERFVQVVLALAPHAQRGDEGVELVDLADASPRLKSSLPALGAALRALPDQKSAQIRSKLLPIDRSAQHHVLAPIAVQPDGLLPEPPDAPRQHDEVVIELFAQLVLANTHLVQVATSDVRRSLARVLGALTLPLRFAPLAACAPRSFLPLLRLCPLFVSAHYGAATGGVPCVRKIRSTEHRARLRVRATQRRRCAAAACRCRVARVGAGRGPREVRY